MTVLPAQESCALYLIFLPYPFYTSSSLIPGEYSLVILHYKQLYYLNFKYYVSITHASGSADRWSTTYNCPDWKTTDGAKTGCDGIIKYGDWTCKPEGSCEQITSAANYPSGGGGSGQRHWFGDGNNILSGGTALLLHDVYPYTSQKEIWMRWYFRYQNGFQWNPLGYEKNIYVFSSTGNDMTFSWYGDKFTVYAMRGDGYGIGKSGVSSSFGWNTLFPSGKSDGSWHYTEVHVKTESSAGSNDGISEVWMDGVKILSATNRNYGFTTGWDRVLIGSNQNNPNNGGCYYHDYDDIAISNTGYIGELSGTITPTPTLTTPVPTPTLIPRPPGVLPPITANIINQLSAWLKSVFPFLPW